MHPHPRHRPAALPALACEEIVDVYLKDVDRTLIRENLKLTHAQRAEKLQGVVRFLEDTRGIARTPIAPKRFHPVADPDQQSPHSEKMPQLAFEEIVDVYLKDIDRTLVRENLKMTPGQRAENFNSFVQTMTALRGIARKRRPVKA